MERIGEAMIKEVIFGSNRNYHNFFVDSGQEKLAVFWINGS